MADPTLGLTFKDLQTRVAEYLGVYTLSGGVAVPPTDTYQLDLVKRLVNDGYRKAVNANPKWRVLEVPITISVLATLDVGATMSVSPQVGTIAALAAFPTNYFQDLPVTLLSGPYAGETRTIVNLDVSGNVTFSDNVVASTGNSVNVTVQSVGSVHGDNSRWYLPSGYTGRLLTPWTMASGDPVRHLTMVDEAMIRELQNGTVISGIPQYVAHRIIAMTPSTDVERWELLIWPTPTQAVTLTTLARLYPDKLVNDGDRHILRTQNDELVLAAALAEADRQVNDTIGMQAQNYQTALAAAMDMDRRSAPRRVGGYGDGSDSGGFLGRPNSYYAVDSYTQATTTGNVYSFN